MRPPHNAGEYIIHDDVQAQDPDDASMRPPHNAGEYRRDFPMSSLLLLRFNEAPA